MKPKQEEALRDYLRESIVPLIEDVLTKKLGQAITFAKEDLAVPVQEPVGVFVEDDDIGHVRLIPHQQLKLKDGDKLYTTPPAAKRTWVGLTPEEIDTVYRDMQPPVQHWQLARTIEAKLKEKNT